MSKLKNFSLRLLAFSTLLALSSCMSKSTPENALKEFIDYRFHENQNKENLVNMSTGKMRQMFEDMTDDEFQKYKDSHRLKKGKFQILSKNCGEDRCYITYIISYKTMNEPVAEGQSNIGFTTEVKKIAEVVREKEIWKLADVDNIKTFHEAHDPITP